LRHDNRRGLRMRCGGRELRRRQGSRGEQQMRRFVMMSLVPGIGLTATEWPSLACQLVD
jgi:hypothetical protein